MIVLAAGNCNRMQCSNGGTCFETSSGSSALAQCICKSGYIGRSCETG